MLPWCVQSEIFENILKEWFTLEIKNCHYLHAPLSVQTCMTSLSAEHKRYIEKC